jgi:hypothetical protein
MSGRRLGGAAGQEDRVVGGGPSFDVPRPSLLGIDRPGGGDQDTGVDQAFREDIPDATALLIDPIALGCLLLQKGAVTPSPLLGLGPSSGHC